MYVILLKNHIIFIQILYQCAAKTVFLFEFMNTERTCQEKIFQSTVTSLKFRKKMSLQ